MLPPTITTESYPPAVASTSHFIVVAEKSVALLVTEASNVKNPPQAHVQGRTIRPATDQDPTSSIINTSSLAPSPFLSPPSLVADDYPRTSRSKISLAPIPRVSMLRGSMSVNKRSFASGPSEEWRGSGGGSRLAQSNRIKPEPLSSFHRRSKSVSGAFEPTDRESLNEVVNVVPTLSKMSKRPSLLATQQPALKSFVVRTGPESPLFGRRSQSATNLEF